MKGFDAALPSSRLRTAVVPPASAPRPTPPAAARSSLDALKSRTPRPGEASFLYRDHHFNVDTVKVLPGEYYVTSDDLMIMTVLGSCIAACIWDPKVKVGGMNHFMLPEGAGDTSGRYGSYAMELLINELLKKGASRLTLEAKIFGGGAVIGGMSSINVGERNTQFVINYLQTERIPFVSRDLLEIYPRKVCFLPASGKAMVKRLASANTEALAAQERAAATRAVPATSTGGSVDLF